ncbi:helix-turn-helix domain-containing protein [Enterococcus sp. LJL98]
MGNEILIGDYLRQARLNKNINLDELQQKTKIQKRYLEAIEKGSFDLLPGDYYVRTFIRQYATVVGVDGNRLVAIYDGESSFGAPLPKREKPVSVEGSRVTSTVKKKNWLDYLPTILMGLIATMILVIVGYFTLQNKPENPMIDVASSIDVHQKSETQPSTTSQETSATTTSTSEATSASSQEEKPMVMKTTHLNAQDTIVEVTEAKEPLKLDFTALDGRCWVGVMVNGAYLLQQTLEPGDKQSIALPKGTEEVAIVLGASANVDLTLNEELLPFKEGDMPLLQKNITLKLAAATTNE